MTFNGVMKERKCEVRQMARTPLNYWESQKNAPLKSALQQLPPILPCNNMRRDVDENGGRIAVAFETELMLESQRRPAVSGFEADGHRDGEIAPARTSDLERRLVQNRVSVHVSRLLIRLGNLWKIRHQTELDALDNVIRTRIIDVDKQRPAMPVEILPASRRLRVFDQRMPIPNRQPPPWNVTLPLLRHERRIQSAE